MRDGERGQGTVEWVGLACLVSLAAGRAGRGRGAGAGGCAGAGGRLADSLRGCAGRRLWRRAGADRRLRDRSRRAGAAAHAARCSSSRGRGRCRSTSGAAARPSCGDGAERGLGPPHRRGPAGHRLRPRRRLPAGCGGGVRSRGRRLLGPARRQPLPPVLDLLRGLGDPARRPDRRRGGLPPRRLGGGPDPHPARRRGRRAGLLAQRLQLRPGPVANWGSDAGIDPLKDAAEALGLARRERLGPRDPPARSSPAAATPATPPASPTSTASPRAAAST